MTAGAAVPRMPRTNQRRGLLARAAHVKRLEAKVRAEKCARLRAERELRVLRRLRFHMADQTPSVIVSLRLIGHTCPG